MAIITKKTDFVLEAKSKFTYRIYKNGNGEMSVEVQLTKDFKDANLKNFALVTMSVEDFEKRMDLKKINDLFLMLRKRIAPYGIYLALAPDYYGFVEA